MELALDPLIAEAKQRMRRRRGLLLVAVVAGTVLVVLTFALRPPSASPVGVSFQRGGLKVTAPRGFEYRDVRSGPHDADGRLSVIGFVTTNFHMSQQRAGIGGTPFYTWAGHSQPPPANYVALQFSKWFEIGLVCCGDQANLHLPLSLDQPWHQQRLSSGAGGYRYGFLRANGRMYEVFFWSGSAASSEDRAAILDALTSLRPAH